MRHGIGLSPTAKPHSTSSPSTAEPVQKLGKRQTAFLKTKARGHLTAKKQLLICAKKRIDPKIVTVVPSVEWPGASAFRYGNNQ
ncbi:hypothetical protein [Pseudomonas sp. S1(2024)]|uniref:hypothetical protein n=1 Tax=Pseudomonas sp. S1(2024) TaxID=3390191 RepID=UPI00397BF84E